MTFIRTDSQPDIVLAFYVHFFPFLLYYFIYAIKGIVCNALVATVPVLDHLCKYCHDCSTTVHSNLETVNELLNIETVTFPVAGLL
jgi:hypothetical protein